MQHVINKSCDIRMLNHHAKMEWYKMSKLDYIAYYVGFIIMYVLSLFLSDDKCKEKYIPAMLF